VRNAEFYDIIYLTNPHKWESESRNAFAYEQVKEYNPNSIIDVGCGSGHTLKYFSDKFPNATCYGTDLSSEAVWLANNKLPCEYFTGDFMEQELPHCDLALCMGVAEHFEKLVDFLVKLGNTADIIYLEVPNCLSYSESKEEGFRMTNEGSDQEEWHLTHDEWEKRIGYAGLKILKAIQGQTKATEFVWVLCHTK